MTSRGYDTLARLANGGPERPGDGRGHPVGPGDIAIGVIIGRTSEFFDFFVYAIASVLVFPKLVFPFLPPLQATLASFAVFALAFLARPIGSVWFIGLDRAYGRGFKLTVALVLLGGSTAAIAFLPGYDTIGAGAAALLALFRLGQGFAQGGTWDGLPTLLALGAPAGRRGWYAMIPQLGAPLGLIVASLLFAFFTASSRCLRGCGLSNRPRSKPCTNRAIWCPNARFARWRTHGARSLWGRLPRLPALRCFTWSRCSRCRG